MGNKNVKKILGSAIAVAIIVVTGCGKTTTGAVVLKKSPYVIALSQPAGSVQGSLYAISPTAGTVQKLDLNVGIMPNSMLRDGSTIYVVNAGDSTISVISVTETTSSIYMTNQGSILLPTGSFPEYITATTVDGIEKGYVSLNQTNRIAVLNMNMHTILKYISIPSYKGWEQKYQPHPWGISVIDGKVMAANFGTSYADFTYASPGMVSVINPLTDTLLSPVTTSTGVNLQAVMPLTASGFVVISNGNYGSIGGYAELFDTNMTENKTIPLSGGGANITISTTGIGYVALNSMVGYDVVNTNTGAFITTTDLTKQVSGLTGYNLTSLKLSPDGKLWATDWSDRSVFEIDPNTNKVIKTYKLKEPAQDVVFMY